MNIYTKSRLIKESNGFRRNFLCYLLFDLRFIDLFIRLGAIMGRQDDDRRQQEEHEQEQFEEE